MWYHHRQYRVNEYWFTFKGERGGFDLSESFAAFDALFYYWKQLDQDSKYQDTHCPRYGCTWRPDCDGIHFMRRAAFRSAFWAEREAYEEFLGRVLLAA